MIGDAMNLGQFLTISNAGQAIAETNYYDSVHARQGLFYLTWNAGAGRILVPDNQRCCLSEMGSAKHVIFSRGRWPERSGIEAIEILFEDDSEEPYVLTIPYTQCDRLLPATDQGKVFPVTVWTRGGEQLRRPGRYRVVKRLPCLKEWAFP